MESVPHCQHRGKYNVEAVMSEFHESETESNKVLQPLAYGASRRGESPDSPGIHVRQLTSLFVRMIAIDTAGIRIVHSIQFNCIEEGIARNLECNVVHFLKLAFFR